jgi:RNA polymerase sigma factor (sigma-70 family)
MALETGAACRAHDGCMHRPGLEDEPVARLERDGPALGTDEERDRSRGTHEDLRVEVRVGGVRTAGSVRPAVRLDALGPQASLDTGAIRSPVLRSPCQELETIGRRRHGAIIVPPGHTATDGRQGVLKGSMDTDAVLAARLAADLDRAFPDLVTAHRDRLYTIALRLLGDSRDAEEVAQDALVRAFRAIAGYPAERTASLRLRPWLASITVNLARNKRRRIADRRPPATLDAMIADGFDPVDDVSPSPASHAARREAQAELAGWLLLLPPAVRSAVVLRHVDGLSVAETAEALGRPEGTVKAQVARGLARMRELITAGPGSAGTALHPGTIADGRAFAAAEVAQ